ncbi:hypothetical protein OROMI_029233 [Orobanche minor]
MASNQKNVMDVEHLLNYLNDNDVVMEMRTDDEIIESVLNDENDPEPDDSSATPNVSSKEAYQAHGAEECLLDVTEACAINAWPSVETHFRFIYCVEQLHLMNRHSEWRSCFGSTHLDSYPLDNCYNNGLGYQLEKEYAVETGNLNPRHRFVPWVVVNNLPLQEDFQNFISYICEAYYKGSSHYYYYKAPNACSTNSKSFQIYSSHQIATSTP